MKSLFHHIPASQPSNLTYGNTGQSAMGRPDLDVWHLFVRETLQNSWDARLPVDKSSQVTFSLDYYTLEGELMNFLRTNIFPEDARSPKALMERIKQDRLSLLVVADAGTVGLRGQTNSAEAVRGHSEYRSFVLELGRPPDKELKGGTYGLGKGVFFSVSRCETVLVYSRTWNESGERENRFIAMTNEAGFEYNNRTFSGRHWWGSESEFWDEDLGRADKYAGPVVGSEADEIANLFGLDKYFIDDNSTGTCIAVVDPDVAAPSVTLDEGSEDLTSDLVMKELAFALTKWAWPHMVTTLPSEPNLRFTVSHNNEEVTVPDPSLDSTLSSFVSCYKDTLHVDSDKAEGLRLRRGTDISSVRSSVPKAALGSFGIREIPKDVSLMTSNFPELKSSIALMREPRMIVTYEKGIPDPLGREYAAVFMADPDLDPLFALSEPQSHDAWSPATVKLEGDDKKFWGRTNPVSNTKTHIEKLIRSWAGDPELREAEHLSSGARQLSMRVGGMFLGQPGSGLGGGSPRVSTQHTGTKNKKSADANVVFDGISPAGNDVLAEFSVDVNLTIDGPPVFIKLKPFVELDDGKTFDPDDLIDFPIIAAVEEIAATRIYAGDKSKESSSYLYFKITQSGVAARVWLRQSRHQAIGLHVEVIGDFNEK